MFHVKHFKKTNNGQRLVEPTARYPLDVGVKEKDMDI